eukprot:CAMPEP_0181301098 /NCGR_PEP_ID=MMETSP1101-20121128/7241_1 /TAXON_ID=46948 /ORGANISM="Rhodomonas abbreviata, Strain Caron Lab Isolate" /LENGTH=397 /DNA_ID=CAMNT_0023406377 /DNA_START=93 /DNA_END=1282 /DNA_ORIENTATION=-
MAEEYLAQAGGKKLGTGADLEDSNMANYGSKEHVDARKAAAESETEFVGAGQKVGLEIWRVENKRTESDTPDFGVKRWPKEDYGQFYTGDSYIILNTYKDKEGDALLWDVHFWLGSESSQDEIGVAAYKTVELDDLLDDGPIQHRETQEHESSLFQSYFSGIQYLEGGIASGFRKVKPEEYEPRLFQVRRTRKTVRATQVHPVAASTMNSGDVFVLDLGLTIYCYMGDMANAFERMKGGALAHNLVGARNGKARKREIDDDFWKALGGTEADVQPPQEHEDMEAALDINDLHLMRLSDASGSMTFKEEGKGKLEKSMLDSNDVFIVNARIEIFVWVGKKASKSERSQAFKFADQYLKESGLPSYTPVSVIHEGQINHVFGSSVAMSALANAAAPPVN